ncbi:hypothetical protein DITRI_Ditri09bG0091700 [Diplodiscus trichospermus]
MARNMNQYYWPEELVTKILLRLPAKSIIRFKCVAKTWRSLFENSSFVSQHLSHGKEVNNRLLVYSYDNTKKPSPDEILIRLFLDQKLVSYQDLLRQVPQHVHTRSLLLSVHDGLVCLCDTINSRITLWNPATRKSRLLPKFNVINSPMVYIYEHHIGFGSDSCLNDYKVIYIRSYVDLVTDIRGPRHHAVYRTSTDSWRLLQGDDVDVFRGLNIIDNSNNACVNGVYYWMVFKFLCYFKVLAFHLSNEVFQLIDWPPVPNPAESIGQLLPLPDNRISLWVSDSDVTDGCNDIWVLNDERQKRTKLFRIGPISGVQRIYGFHNKNPNKVYIESVSGHLLLYDFDTQEYKDIGIKTSRVMHLLDVHIYQESLIATSRDHVE